MDRRSFIGAGLAAGAAALGAGSHDVAAASPGVRAYRRLGRTGIEMSDISFGSSSSADPALVRHALDRGVNYFDSAESYRWGSAEEAIGQALVGVRDRVHLTSKTKAGAHDGWRDIMAALEGSLRRLRTDYVDVYFNHAVNDLERIRNPEWGEFTERAKAAGKIRWSGMSGHGSRLVECLDHALDHDLVDVILVAYNFGLDPDFYDRLRHTFHYVAIQPELPRVIEKARARDVGVIAMKTLMGGRLNDLRPYERGGATYAQAALRWVLASARVHGALISMTSTDGIDEYLGASGATITRADDLRLLDTYLAINGANQCRQGCATCAASCPIDVPIAEVLRTRMYAVDYGDARLGREDYAKLGAPAAGCLGCETTPCASACPHGVPIARFAREAARLLG